MPQRLDQRLKIEMVGPKIARCRGPGTKKMNEIVQMMTAGAARRISLLHLCPNTRPHHHKSNIKSWYSQVSFLLDVQWSGNYFRTGGSKTKSAKVWNAK